MKRALKIMGGTLGIEGRAEPKSFDLLDLPGPVAPQGQAPEVARAR
jgi:hypothetical protein